MIDGAGRGPASVIYAPRVPLPPPSSNSAALVTGASSGIGADIARELASRGHAIVLVARREDRLTALADELRDAGARAEVIPADLSDENGRDLMQATIQALGLEIEILVNNAGFGNSAPLHRAERERILELVRLNCEALIDLQARYSPAMADRGRGAILNVASTAAFQPLPGTAAYAASKSFVLSLSEATHTELSGRGVTVTALCPGPVRTEFAEVAGVGGAEDKLPDLFWTESAEVAAAAVAGLESGKRVVVPGLINRAGALGGQHAPRMLVLPLTRRLWQQARHEHWPPRSRSRGADRRRCGSDGRGSGARRLRGEVRARRLQAAAAPTAADSQPPAGPARLGHGGVARHAEAEGDQAIPDPGHDSIGDGREAKPGALRRRDQLLGQLELPRRRRRGRSLPRDASQAEPAPSARAPARSRWTRSTGSRAACTTSFAAAA